MQFIYVCVPYAIHFMKSNGEIVLFPPHPFGEIKLDKKHGLPGAKVNGCVVMEATRYCLNDSSVNVYLDKINIQIKEDLPKPVLLFIVHEDVGRRFAEEIKEKVAKKHYNGIYGYVRVLSPDYSTAIKNEDDHLTFITQFLEY